MTFSAVVTTKAEIELSVDLVAQWFCELTDEQQAEFFVAVSRQASSWKLPQSEQWYNVGRHLATCGCATDDARDLVRNIADGVGR